MVYWAEHSAMTWDTWKKRQFNIRFQRAEEGGYIVSIPEMPGCVTQAESFEEGLAMIKDALEGLLYVSLKHGDEIPEQFQDLAEELVPSSRRARNVGTSGRQTARAQAG